MSNVTSVRGQLTDAMIDHIVISMTGKQRTSALRDALARLRDLEAENVELRGRVEASSVGWEWTPAGQPPDGREDVLATIELEDGTREVAYVEYLPRSGDWYDYLLGDMVPDGVVSWTRLPPPDREHGDGGGE